VVSWILTVYSATHKWYVIQEHAKTHTTAQNFRSTKRRQDEGKEFYLYYLIPKLVHKYAPTSRRNAVDRNHHQ